MPAQDAVFFIGGLAAVSLAFAVCLRVSARLDALKRQTNESLALVRESRQRAEAAAVRAEAAADSARESRKKAEDLLAIIKEFHVPADEHR